ncbi:DUF3383 family protein [Alicyclobacillus macrosporangiidus]|uniref:Phage tail sheath protein n=1 Tax=Alicyclobacillus macrosporangiidus TaxID=392015 RepID=A0A1I7IDU5_9BACL|nr:DUF3383 family protein [Alicyclobacillus macrosporangiidus]SFU71119.1 Protein of unknown function [Alicyclobacillus macrosporangiidus]
MTLSLADIVNITVEVSPSAASPNAMNVGLIVGASTVIPTATRTRQYNSTTDMLSDGWTGTEPEYKAAQAYFEQSPAPSAVVIGRQDTTASETPLQAVQACRAADSTWYGCYVCGAQDADIEAVAQYIETASPASVFFYDTQDANVASGTTPNVMSTLQSDKYHRTLGMYSTSQYAGAALLGRAMGLNTGLAGSAFTLAYKNLTGVTPENLTSTQASAILGYNGNIYANYGGQYNLLRQGTMADGTPFDEVLNLDVITADIQTSVMNALTQSPKIPQTEDGVTMLVNTITAPCERARIRGMIAPGVWQAAPVLGKLNTGDTLASGYLVLADSLANQSQADRDARKSPPIYVCLKMAGAVEHVVIGVIVNQ